MNNGALCLYDSDTEEFAVILEYNMTIYKVREHFENFEATEIVDENGNYAKIKHLAKRLIEDTNGDYYMIIKKHYFLVYDAKSGIFAKPVEEYWEGGHKEPIITETISSKVRKWATERGIYEKSTPFKQLEKTYEELMELMEGLTAWKQGLAIFKNSKGENVNTLDAIKDAYGDIAVTLENGTAFFDYTLEEAEQTAFKEIEHRTGKMINGSYVKN